MDIDNICIWGLHNKGETNMKNGKIASLMISSGVTLISIGILNILAEASEKIKTFLTLNQAVGPYSGKLVYAVIIGIITWFIASSKLKNKDVNINKAFVFLFIALLLATLFVFTPFIHLILGN